MSTKTPDQNVARLFRALAVESRVRIVALLAEHTLCVGALAKRLHLSAAAVSQHLRVLRDAELVQPDRRGYFVHYRLTAAAARRCRAALDAVLGAGTKLPARCGGKASCRCQQGGEVTAGAAQPGKTATCRGHVRRSPRLVRNP